MTVSHVIVQNWSSTGGVRTTPWRYPWPRNQSQDMKPVENLCSHVTLEIVTSDNPAQVDRLAHDRFEPWSHQRPPRQSVYDAEKR